MSARRPWIAIGAVCGFLGVALGAFGAHGLQGRATPEQLEWWRTASLYHLLHVLPLVVIGVLPAGRRGTAAVGWTTLAGILLFSGSLYAMGLGGPRWLGAVTPFGGLAFLVGWLLLARLALAEDAEG